MKMVGVGVYTSSLKAANEGIGKDLILSLSHVHCLRGLVIFSSYIKNLLRECDKIYEFYRIN